MKIIYSTLFAKGVRCTPFARFRRNIFLKILQSTGKYDKITKSLHLYKDASLKRNKYRKAVDIMKKRKLNPMPFNLAVFMLVIGILMGSIFTFGEQYWNKNVPREECMVVKTQFLSYDERWNVKPTLRIVEIAIDCADGNTYYIDGVSINEELQDQLSLLSKNDNITLLIHPNSNTIVEFFNDQTVLLTYEETISKLDGESFGFLFLGFFMYFCALVGLYYIVYHIIRRKTK